MQVRNILSVDFDKFMSMDLDAEGHLLDGKVSEIPKYPEKIQWLRRYYHSPELLEVGINEEDEQVCLSYLFKQLQDIPVYVSDSHKYMIRFLVDVIEFLHTPGAVYNIYNIDQHHDIYYGAPPDIKRPPFAINWVSYIHQSHKLQKYSWIKNVSSVPFKGEQSFEYAETTDYSVLKGVLFDGIHICKSSPWVPPHLDRKFNTFVNALKCHFNDIRYSDEPFIAKQDLNSEDILDAIQLVHKVKWL